jgi:S1-C subfamily serine protease
MRSQVLLGVLAAIFGGGVTAALLLATGAVSTSSQTTMLQATTPLLGSGPVGGTAAGNVYRGNSAGVVGVTARSVPVSASAFDLPSRRPDGMLSGSGFVLDDDGHIATAAHLVRAASDVQVYLAGRSVPARVVGVDEGDDLAVLRVDAPGLDLQPLKLGDSDSVRVGDPAIAIGRTAGLEATLTTGTIAAQQSRVPAAGGASLHDALEVDAPLDEEDCGGPLLDASGHVTGINTRMVTATGDTVDLAIPVDTLRRLLPQLSGKAMKVVSG